jgi:hypothetical protein
MPAFDVCHDQVVRALNKVGWQVDRAPYRVSAPYRTIFIDLKLSFGSNGNHQQILLVEIKCFPDENSTTKELYASFGQYLVYRAMLMELGRMSPIYLAVPETIFLKIFDIAVMQTVGDNQIKVVVVNLEAEEVIKWIE